MEEINYFNELERIEKKLNRDMSDKWQMINDVIIKLNSINDKLNDLDDRVSELENVKKK